MLLSLFPIFEKWAKQDLLGMFGIWKAEEPHQVQTARQETNIDLDTKVPAANYWYPLGDPKFWD